MAGRGLPDSQRAAGFTGGEYRKDVSVTNQIVLNGLPLPQASFDRYACREESLTRQLDMISGRRVLERIGRKWKVWRVRGGCG